MIDIFEFYGFVVLLLIGGIGGNVEVVWKVWLLDCLGLKVFESFVIGVFVYVDGCMIGIVEGIGVYVVNCDCMWYYIEGF